MDAEYPSGSFLRSLRNVRSSTTLHKLANVRRRALVDRSGERAAAITYADFGNELLAQNSVRGLRWTPNVRQPEPLFRMLACASDHYAMERSRDQLRLIQAVLYERLVTGKEPLGGKECSGRLPALMFRFRQRALQPRAPLQSAISTWWMATLTPGRRLKSAHFPWVGVRKA